MRQLYTIELVCLVKELREFEGYYVDKFYEDKDDTFRFALSRKGSKANLRCVLPFAINRTAYISPADEPTNFAIAVRKRIAGFMIEGIMQYNNDRIVLIKLTKGEDAVNLILEMFGKGNLVIADKGMKILLVYKPHIFKDRDVRVNSTYAQPKSANIDILDQKAVSEAISRLGAEKETISATISKNIGIGTLYIEDALAKIGIEPKKKTADIGDKLDDVARSINDEIELCTNSKTVLLYEKDGGIADFAMCGIEKYSQFNKTECNSLQDALDKAYQMAPHVARKNEQAEGLKQSIEKQSALLKEIDDQIAAEKNTGDMIFKNMQQINEIIKKLKENKRMTKEELQAFAKGIKILDVNLKEKTVSIEI